MSESIQVAVITGNHQFDVPAFHRLFRALPGVDAYIQHMDDWAADAGKMREKYAAVVFYNMPTGIPSAEVKAEQKLRAALEWLGESKQGIVVLHHALLSHHGWPLWSELCGIQDRKLQKYFPAQTVRSEIANGKHPITKGLKPWEMVDETYLMNSADPGCDVLLTTANPNSMGTLAWTKQYKNARVLGYASGHDDLAFSDQNFRTVLGRGILWVSGRL
jgi:hypothetical protein